MATKLTRRHENYRAINVAPTADQAKIVFDKARNMLQNPKATWLVKGERMTPFPTLEFSNGATLEARSTTRDGAHLLGQNYDWISWDEAALESRFVLIRDNVLRMRLLDRTGTLDYTSTGQGRNAYGEYFLEGLGGEERKNKRLYSRSGSTFENPHIPADELREMMKHMSPAQIQQNVYGGIVDASGMFFNQNDLAIAQDSNLDDMVKVLYDEQDQERWVELFPGGQQWRDKYPSHRYVTGWDLADKNDYTVGITYDLSTRPATLVEFERFRRLGWDNVYARMRERNSKYGPKTTKFDSTGLGDVVKNELKDIKAEGVLFTKATKDDLLTNLQSVLSQRMVRYPMIKVFRDEHAFYEREDKDLRTDCVMANAIACRWVKRGGGSLYFAKPISV